MMTRYRWILLVPALALAMVRPAHGQDDAYRRWLQQQEQQLQKYIDEQDLAFLKFLEKEWKLMPVQKGEVRDDTPKPVDIPEADPLAPRIPDRTAPETRPNLPPKTDPKPEPDDEEPAPDEEEPAPDEEVSPEDVLPDPENDPDLNPNRRIDLGDRRRQRPPLPEPEAQPTARPRTQPAAKPQPDTQPTAKPRPETQPTAKPQPEARPAVTPPADAPVPTPDAARKSAPDTRAETPATTPKPEARPGAPERQTADRAAMQVAFFDLPLSLNYDRHMVATLNGKPGNESIARFWRAMSETQYQLLLADLQAQREALALNDWGYYLLVRDMAKRLYPDRDAERVLFTWFLLTKSGYAARVAYGQNRLFLLFPSNNQVYRLPAMIVGGDHFYIMTDPRKPEQVGGLYTYEGNYPDATRKIDFAVKATPKLGSKEGHRDVSFKYGTEVHTLAVAYNDGVIRFLESYPQVDLNVHLSAGISTEAAQSLAKGLRPLLAGKSETESVNILLRFVQRSFHYKRDDQSFGYERYLFPEETLFYEFSDCEDRAALFAYLVRTVLNLDVVGLEYPGHVATAVRLSQPVEGASVQFNGARYMVADPTYFGADVGMVMPMFKGKQPKVIGRPAS